MNVLGKLAPTTVWNLPKICNRALIGIEIIIGEKVKERMDIQEIRDLLEKALEVLSWCQENADEKWMVDHLMAVRIDLEQSLALLKQQPTAGKFTKECRAHCEVAYRGCEINQEQIQNVIKNTGLLGIEVRLAEGMLAAKKGIELCDRLDSAEAENQKLKNQKEYIYKKEVAQLKMAESINADLLEACLKIQTARNEYRQTGKEFDYKELDKTLDAAIAKASKEG